MQAELPLGITWRERRDARKTVRRANKADEVVARAGGEDAPTAMRVLRHLCAGRTPFTAGFVAEVSAVDLNIAEHWITAVHKLGWCVQCSNMDNPPHKGRGKHFYTGRL